MLDEIPAWLGIAGIIIGALIGLVGAIAILRSKYKLATDTEREKYILALEARNKLLEETNTRQGQELRDAETRFSNRYEALSRRHHTLEGKFCFLQDLVLRQCRNAEIDPETGACTFCKRSLLYGQLPLQQQGGSQQ